MVRTAIERTAKVKIATASRSIVSTPVVSITIVSTSASLTEILSLMRFTPTGGRLPADIVPRRSRPLAICSDCERAPPLATPPVAPGEASPAARAGSPPLPSSLSSLLRVGLRGRGRVRVRVGVGVGVKVRVRVRVRVTY